MVFKVTIAIDGMVPAQPLGPMVFDGFHSVNHWWRCFSMVANHWSNDAMVTIHCSGLDQGLCKNAQCALHIESHFLNIGALITFLHIKSLPSRCQFSRRIALARIAQMIVLNILFNSQLTQVVSETEKLADNADVSFSGNAIFWLYMHKLAKYTVC